MGRPGTPAAKPFIALALLVALAACATPETSGPEEGSCELTLVILDASTDEPVPARVELLDKTGRGHVAADALPIVALAPTPRHIEPIDASFETTRRFANPQSGTDQFYSSGRSTLFLAPGDYHLRVWKGPEYRAVENWLEVPAAEEHRVEARLHRWIDMPGRDWYSADDHLHLPRPNAAANAPILQWMAAEDIHVANLLQMGAVDRFDFAPQYAHGADGRYREGHHILVSGQENPRTHFLGHTVILGTDSPIRYPDTYLDFARFFREGHRQGALNGFGHYGQHAGAQFGLGLTLPHDLVDFLEVLQMERGQYDIWYKILNSGFRLTPTAGTDYPWGHSYPGRERFYTRVRGEFTVEKWLSSVRAGRTFVTNGPMLHLNVDGQGIGSTVELPGPGVVDVASRVEFDPGSDLVSELEILEDGVVARTFPVGQQGAGRIAGRFRHQVQRSGWLAARASGLKRGEAPVRQALAHTAPIYISVGGTPPLTERQEARRMARSWIAILDDLEEALSDENISDLAQRVASAPVELEVIRRNRPALLEAIAEARARFREQSR